MIGTAMERHEVLDQLYPVWKKHTLWTYFQMNSERFSDRDFLIFENEKLTYAQTLEQVNRAALGLFAIGIRPRDHVAVSLHNRPEFAVLIFALSKIGAVKIPVNANLKEEELKFVLEKSDVTFLISENELSNSLRCDLRFIKKTVVFTDPAPDDKTNISWKMLMNFAVGKDTKEMEKNFADCQNPDSLCDIMFTSGSTATPKGVMMTHDMLIRSAYCTARSRCMEVGRRMYIPIPMFHAFAYVEGILALLTIGGAAIMSRGKFDVETGLRLMREYHANDVICVSPIMINILCHGKPVAKDYPDMHAAYWAMSSPDWIWDEARKAFNITDIGTGYGMTECASTTSLSRPTDPPEYLKEYNGQLKEAGCAAAPGFDGHTLQVKICNQENGEDLSTGEIGEILVRGLTVMSGYYKNPKENKVAFDAEGWFHTGDLGFFNEEGFLSFQGRNDDMYKVNGENVSPKFVECIISKDPNVNAVEVVGIKHPKYGEVGVAFVDAKDTTDDAKEKLKQFCKTHLARFQCPYIFFWGHNDTWPRTGTGKIHKNELREIAKTVVEKECAMTEHEAKKDKNDHESIFGQNFGLHRLW